MQHSLENQHTVFTRAGSREGAGGPFYLKIVIFNHLMLVDAIVMIMSQFEGAQTWLWT